MTKQHNTTQDIIIYDKYLCYLIILGILDNLYVWQKTVLWSNEEQEF